MVIGGRRVVACVVCMHDSVHRPCHTRQLSIESVNSKVVLLRNDLFFIEFFISIFSSDFPKYKFIFTKSISLFFF